MKRITLLVFLIFLGEARLFPADPGDFFADGPKDKKAIALTFDDGPGPHTGRFLDLLGRYQVKATFFMLGNRVRKHPKTAKEVADRGHDIGSHTWAHINYKDRLREIQKQDNEAAIPQAVEELKADMMKTRQVIENTTGIKLKILRMPHGVDRPWVNEAAKEAGFVLINWSFGADWQKNPIDELKKSYINAIRPGAILLFHDGGGNREKSLLLVEAVLQAAREKGYDIVSVGMMLGLQ